MKYKYIDYIIKVITVLEVEAMRNCVLIVKNFLGNYKAPNYEEIVKNIPTNFQTLSANKSIKWDYRSKYLDTF